jgi:hypothetical protein
MIENERGNFWFLVRDGSSQIILFKFLLASKNDLLYHTYDGLGTSWLQYKRLRENSLNRERFASFISFESILFLTTTNKRLDKKSRSKYITMTAVFSAHRRTVQYSTVQYSTVQSR